MVRGESAGRNDTVDVGMQEQVLSPGVERADDADLRSQVFGIGGDFEQSLSAGGEQQVVEQSWIFQGQQVEFMGHGKDHMKVAGGQKFAFPCRQPAFPCLCLALGAVSVSARVVGDGLITAARALVAMSTQGSGAAALNGTKGFELLKVEARSIPIQEAIALHVEDVGHLEGGPSHGIFLRWY